jgi:endonuclease YncB( thermonuclease family)
LQQAIATGRLSLSVVGEDRYGRSLANVYVEGRNISCDLIAQGIVQYVERWDDNRLLAKDCPELSL